MNPGRINLTPAALCHSQKGENVSFHLQSTDLFSLASEKLLSFSFLLKLIESLWYDKKQGELKGVSPGWGGVSA